MSDSDIRDTSGRFAKGNPGGPGRPRNPISSAAVELDRLGTAVAEELMLSTIERARRGNLRATEMVLQRVWPARRHRSIELDPAPGNGMSNLLNEHVALAHAMMNGEITPQDAQARCVCSRRCRSRCVEPTGKTVCSPKTAKTEKTVERSRRRAGPLVRPASSPRPARRSGRR